MTSLNTEPLVLVTDRASAFASFYFIVYGSSLRFAPSFVERCVSSVALGSCESLYILHALQRQQEIRVFH